MHTSQDCFWDDLQNELTVNRLQKSVASSPSGVDGLILTPVKTSIPCPMCPESELVMTNNSSDCGVLCETCVQFLKASQNCLNFSDGVLENAADENLSGASSEDCEAKSGASSELSGDVQPVVASESNDLSNVTRRLILGRGNHCSDVKAPFLPAFMDKVRPQLFVFMFLCV